MHEDDYCCEAPENKIKKKSKDDNWKSPADYYLSCDKQPRDLNENNDCPYFKEGEPHS